MAAGETDARVRVAGGCHCGAVRFTADVPRTPELLDCNCSICSKTGFLHLIVRHEDFRLVAAPGAITTYRFGSGAAAHLFCTSCGIKSFYQPRSHPDAWSVNYRALDEGHALQPVLRAFDGRDWDSAMSALA